MYHPTFKEFKRLSKKGNLVPVYKEILADLETPVSAFMKIMDDDYAYLLESVEGTQKIARYSFLGAHPSLIFKAKDNIVEITAERKKKKITFKTDPLLEIKKIMQQFKSVEVKDLPRFYGGMVGFIGYDMVKFFEPKLKILDSKKRDVDFPDAVFMLSDKLFIFDHFNHKIKIVACVFIKDKKKIKGYYHKGLKDIEAMHKRLKGPLKKQFLEERPCAIGQISSNLSKPRFTRIVNEAKRYIRQGDIIQVVLSQRFKVGIDCRPLSIYRRLRSINPSPYMFCLKLHDLSLIGSSPEMLIRCEGGLVQTRPIAGTRPRGRDEESDNLLARQLLLDKKERAEHIMLVDLGRNDLGRVCRFSTVRVSEFMSIERFSHVMHITSEVTGRLRAQEDIYSLLRGAFPAGTVTGSPKIRAMEIINELEDTRRGPYAGCIGYFSFSGNLDTCITIRTIFLKGKTAYFQSGAGIVADSRPVREYNETINKARALVEAIVGLHK
ncbi:MAG: anthranilate synthase component I [Candidatus Omnitrophota bacterium]